MQHKKYKITFLDGIVITFHVCASYSYFLISSIFSACLRRKNYTFIELVVIKLLSTKSS